MSQYWIPRDKNGLVDLIVKSGKWTGTKTALRAMEKKQLVAILHRIRQEHFNNLMTKDINICPTTETK